MIWLRLAPYIGLLLLAAGLLWYRGQAIDAEAERDKARAELAIAVEANQAQQDAIRRITAQRAQDDRLLSQFIEIATQLNSSQAELQGSIADLEKQNEDVRQVLSTALPNELKAILNRRR